MVQWLRVDREIRVRFPAPAVIPDLVVMCHSSSFIIHQYYGLRFTLERITPYSNTRQGILLLLIKFLTKIARLVTRQEPDN